MVCDVFTFGQPLANGPGLSLHSDKPLKPWERVVLHSDKPNCLIWADLSLQIDNPTSGIVRGPSSSHSQAIKGPGGALQCSYYGPPEGPYAMFRRIFHWGLWPQLKPLLISCLLRAPCGALHE